MWVWQRRFKWFFSVGHAYQLSGVLLPYCSVLMFLMMGYGLWLALFASPPDYQQGEGVRIMYVHVPAAVLSMAIYMGMAICSLLYLIWQTKLHDLCAKALAPIGALCTLIALLTGSLWGKPMWGTWWVWDARLTSELILLFLYLAYMLLNESIPAGKQNAKACALLALIGSVDIPIIHFSVEWWYTLHQGSSLSLFHKPSIDQSMLAPLMVMGGGCLLWVVVVFMLRLRHLITQFNQVKDMKMKRQKWVVS